jgi:phage repressor protein C with HTH and peptisase S24 domain
MDMQVSTDSSNPNLHRPAEDPAFVVRLRELVAKVGTASALAKKAGISQSGLHRYLSGGEPTRKVLIALAEAGDVNLDWLVTGNGPASNRQAPGSDSLTRVNLYTPPEPLPDTAVPSPNGILTGLAFCRNWLGRQGLDAKTLKAANIRGNSMEPTIRNGDNILIDITSREILDGEIYAIRDGEALMIKRLQRQLGGRVRMISDNALYPVIDAPMADLDVVGKVVWRGSML